MRRLMCAIVVACLVSAFTVVPASAAIGNDDQVNATPLGPFPFSDSVDLREATTSSAETQQCWGLHNAVWYTFTATEDTVLQYGYSAELYMTIYTEVQGPVYFESGCSPYVPMNVSRTIQAPAGSTVYFAVGLSDAEIGSSNSAVVGLYFDAMPMSHLQVNVDARGKVTRSGTAVITGTASCEAPHWVEVDLRVEQQSGHGILAAETGTTVLCEPGGPTPWTAEASTSGKFVGGQASVSGTIACVDSWNCNTAGFDLARVRLNSSVK